MFSSAPCSQLSVCRNLNLFDSNANSTLYKSRQFCLSSKHLLGTSKVLPSSKQTVLDVNRDNNVSTFLQPCDRDDRRWQTAGGLCVSPPTPSAHPQTTHFPTDFYTDWH